ncbi:MAG: DUF3800 domain-containing protein [Mollicutes bacterium PWAP]|nr:DUF3800 domain-containing protein [Mollicutes bacterium PWAP]
MDIKMFVDESGSLNTHKLKIFSITAFFVNKNNVPKIKNKVKRFQIKMKKEIGIDIKNELKAHQFNLSKKTMELNEFLEKINIQNIFTSYIDNRLQPNNSNFYKNKNVTYNFIFKSLCERILDIKNLKEPINVEIIIDKREIGVGSFKSLEEYLRAWLLERNEKINIELKYIDSKEHWGVQLADYYSFVRFRQILENNIKDSEKIRKIY